MSYLSGGINNSIAFNAVNIPAVSSSQVLTLKYDFYNSGDAANTAAGGCCGSAADGAGIGLFPTSTYGLTGASNPSTGLTGPPAAAAFAWETPSVAGALTIGTAIFNTNQLSLDWNGTTLASTDPGFSLKGDQWDRAIVTLTPAGANTAVSVSLIQDINGTPIMFNNVLSGTATGLDIAAGLGTNFRLIAGERDGGAYHNGYLDNFSVTLAPEPGSFLLFGLGGVGLLVMARRRRKA